MTEFVKADQAKARMDLLPPKVLEGVAQVLAFGAKKYAAWNWVKAPAYGRYFAAVQRHLAAWQAGEDLDPETGLPHLHHALCSLMFLAELQRLGEAQDDRPTDARLLAEIGKAEAGKLPTPLRELASAVAGGIAARIGVEPPPELPPAPPTPAEVAAVGEAMPICQRCRYPLTVAGTTAGACQECGAPI